MRSSHKIAQINFDPDLDRMRNIVWMDYYDVSWLVLATSIERPTFNTVFDTFFRYLSISLIPNSSTLITKEAVVVSYN